MSDDLLRPCGTPGCRRRGKVTVGNSAFCGECALEADPTFGRSSTMVVTPDPIDCSTDGRVVRISSSRWLVQSKSRSCFWPVERDAKGIHCGCEAGEWNERTYNGETAEAPACEHARTAVAFEVARDRRLHARPTYPTNASALVD